jgi:hypothetical protein
MFNGLKDLLKSVSECIEYSQEQIQDEQEAKIHDTLLAVENMFKCSKIGNEIWTVRISEGLSDTSEMMLFTEDEPLSPDEIMHLLRLVHKGKVREILRTQKIRLSQLEEF